jgi:hypothetical protein
VNLTFITVSKAHTQTLTFLGWILRHLYKTYFIQSGILLFLLNPMPETDKSIVIAEIDEIKWQSNTGQSVLKSKGLYRTGSPSIQRYFGKCQYFCRFELENMYICIYEILPALDLTQSIHAKISIGMHRGSKLKIFSPSLLPKITN